MEKESKREMEKKRESGRKEVSIEQFIHTRTFRALKEGNLWKTESICFARSFGVSFTLSLI